MADDSQADKALTQANEAAPEGAARPVYEIGFHVVPTVAEGDLGPVVDKIRTALGGAEIIKEQFPSKMNLAYQVERAHQGKREKYNEAYFGWIKFSTESENLPAFKEAIRSMREILRSIVIKTVREDIVSPRRAIFASDRLEGQTLKKPTSTPEASGEVSEEELDKSIEALVQ